MKRSLFFYCFVILFSLMAVSCSTDDDENDSSVPVSCTTDDDENDSSDSSVRYYVKYEVTFNSQHINANRVIKFATENGIQTMTLNQQTSGVSWEGTYGPVSNDFTASIECTTNDYEYRSNIHARIYVCREKEPFVIKAEGQDSKTVSLSYKIDF